MTISKLLFRVDFWRCIPDAWWNCCSVSVLIIPGKYKCVRFFSLWSKVRCIWFWATTTTTTTTWFAYMCHLQDLDLLWFGLDGLRHWSRTPPNRTPLASLGSLWWLLGRVGSWSGRLWESGNGKDGGFSKELQKRFGKFKIYTHPKFNIAPENEK